MYSRSFYNTVKFSMHAHGVRVHANDERDHEKHHYILLSQGYKH